MVALYSCPRKLFKASHINLTRIWQLLGDDLGFTQSIKNEILSECIRKDWKALDSQIANQLFLTAKHINDISLGNRVWKDHTFSL